MSAASVECRNLAYAYTRGGQTLVVLDHLDLTIPKGDFRALTGPSGSGRTTPLNLIAGLDRPVSGEVRVLWVPLGTLSSTALAEWRARHVRFVFSVLQTCCRGCPPSQRRVAAAPDIAHAKPAAPACGHRASDRRDRGTGRDKPSAFSGGQQQRVAIARAIVTDLTLLVCDEPTGDLGRGTRPACCRSSNR